MRSKILFYTLLVGLISLMSWAGYRLFYVQDSAEIAKKVANAVGGSRANSEASLLSKSTRAPTGVWGDDRLKSAVSSGNAIDLKGEASVENNLAILRDLYNRGEDDQLLERLNKLMAENPSVKEYPAFLGDYYYNEGNWPEAEKVVARLLELDPENEFAQTTMGEILAYQGRYEDAQKTLDRVLEKNSKNMDALNGYLSTAEMRGKGEEGEAKIAALAAADPSNGNALTAHAGVLMRAGKLKESKETLEAARRGDPENPIPFQSSGDLAAQEGDFPAALKYYEEALLKQKYVEGQLLIMESLAGVHYEKGDLEGARKTFQRMLSLNPTYEPALQGLKTFEEKERGSKKIPG